MPDSPNSRFEDLGRKADAKIGAAIESAEQELKRAITYINDEIVPQVRENSSQALKTAAEHLARLAEHLSRRSRGQ